MRRYAWGIALGCAHAPECSAHGGPKWTELRTPHFVIRTGLGLAEARETALALLPRCRSGQLPRAAG